MVGAHAICDSADMVGQLFRERKRIAHEAGHALPQGVVAALNVVGFAGFFGDGLVSLRGHHSCVGVILIGMKRRLFTVYERNVGPQRFGTVTTPVAYVIGAWDTLPALVTIRLALLLVADDRAHSFLLTQPLSGSTLMG